MEVEVEVEVEIGSRLPISLMFTSTVGGVRGGESGFINVCQGYRGC